LFWCFLKKIWFLFWNIKSFEVFLIKICFVLMFFEKIWCKFANANADVNADDDDDDDDDDDN